MTFETTNSAYIRKLADVFLACSVGKVVSYGALSAAIGGKPIQDRRYLAATAMRLANAESGSIFRNVRNEGYQRLHGEEAHAVGKDARGKIRRHARRAVTSITNAVVKANDISDSGRLKAYSEQAALGLVQHMTYDRNMPVAREGSAPPPTTDTIRETMRVLREQRASGG